MLNVTSQPNLSSAAFVWRSEDGARYLTIVAKATFDLEPERSPLSEIVEPLRGFDPQSVDDIDSDRVPYKVRSEVIITGAAYAPAAKPVRRFVASFVVGTIDKSMGIVCDRRLTPDGEIVEGPPITKVELGWDKAAHGPTNPIGRTIEARDARGGALLPSLVPPADDLSERVDGIPPIGFGPIPSHWSPRRELGGARGGPYQEGDALVLARDLDHAFFQIAPWDQQQRLTFDADARIVLENLHPEHARLVTNLQALYVAASIRSKLRNDDRPMSADTLIIDTEKRRCAVVYRTATAIGANEELAVEVLAGPSPASMARAELERGPREAMPSLAPLAEDERGIDAEVTHTGTSLSIADAVLPFDHGAVRPARGSQFETAEIQLEALREGAPDVGAKRGEQEPQLQDDWDAALETGQMKRNEVPAPAPPAPAVPAPASLAPASPAPASPAPPPKKPPPASTLFGAGRAPGSALEASNDARTGDGRPAPGRQVAQEPRHVQDVDGPESSRRRMELLWSHEQVGQRIAADRQLARHTDQRSSRRQLSARPPTGEATPRGPRDAIMVLAAAEPIRPAEFEALRARTVQSGGAPPLCTVRGDLVLLFDEQEALRATIGFAAPFNRGDRNLKEAIEMGEAIADSEWSIASSIESAMTRVREQLARVARELTVDVQRASVTRKLLEKRKFRTAVALGGDHLRADFLSSERATPVPMYLPVALKDELPLYERLPIVALVEVRARQDEADSSPHALSVLALARDLDSRLGFPPLSNDARVARTSKGKVDQ